MILMIYVDLSALSLLLFSLLLPGDAMIDDD